MTKQQIWAGKKLPFIARWETVPTRGSYNGQKHTFRKNKRSGSLNRICGHIFGYSIKQIISFAKRKLYTYSNAGQVTVYINRLSGVELYKDLFLRQCK